MMQGNLIHALVESWKFDPVISSNTPGLWIVHISSFAYNADVDVCDTKFSNLVIWSYIVASKKIYQDVLLLQYCKLQQKFRIA